MAHTFPVAPAHSIELRRDLYLVLALALLAFLLPAIWVTRLSFHGPKGETDAEAVAELLDEPQTARGQPKHTKHKKNKKGKRQGDKARKAPPLPARGRSALRPEAPGGAGCAHEPVRAEDALAGAGAGGAGGTSAARSTAALRVEAASGGQVLCEAPPETPPSGVGGPVDDAFFGAAREATQGGPRGRAEGGGEDEEAQGTDPIEAEDADSTWGAVDGSWPECGASRAKDGHEVEEEEVQGATASEAEDGDSVAGEVGGGDEGEAWAEVPGAVEGKGGSLAEARVECGVEGPDGAEGADEAEGGTASAAECPPGSQNKCGNEGRVAAAGQAEAEGPVGAEAGEAQGLGKSGELEGAWSVAGSTASMDLEGAQGDYLEGNVYSRALLLAHWTIRFKILQGPPGLDQDGWALAPPPGLSPPGHGAAAGREPGWPAEPDEPPPGLERCWDWAASCAADAR